jgi:hypothetical protein
MPSWRLNWRWREPLRERRAQLVEKLAAVGVSETEPNIRNKVARGKLTAAFMIQCLTAIELDTVRL